MSPLVSIIVPIYNTAEYVEECIQSILSQSYQSIELILVNDGSTDGSDMVCKKYEYLPNVQYVEQSNSGVVAARKRGVEEAHGEWIMFVDSDDLLLEDGIQQLMLLSAGADIVIGRHHTNTSLLNAPFHFDWDDYLFRLFIHSIPWGSVAKLFKRELICNCSMAFEYTIPRGEDLLMNLAIAKENKKIVPICKEQVYYYRMRQGSTTHTIKYTFDYCENLCSMAESFVRDSFPVDKMLKGEINHRLYYYKKVLAENNFQGDRHHPFVTGIISRMKEAKVLRLSDRVLLGVSNRNTVRCCLFLSKFMRRIENPSLLIDDINRLRNQF